MKQFTQQAIRTALATALSEIAKMPALPEEGHWEYHRGGQGTWHGTIVPKVSFMNMPVIRALDRIAAPVEAAIAKDYPEYSGLVGTALSRGRLQPQMIVGGLLREAYERFGAFTLTSAQIDEVLNEASKFFERRTIRLRLYAPALNLHGSAETPPIVFPGGVILRPTTDEDINRFYGGDPTFRLRSIPVMFPNFVFTKEIETPKHFGDIQAATRDLVLQPFRETLDLCTVVFATFKEGGAVGYDSIWITPGELMFGALFPGQHMFGSEHVPPGNYVLTPEEIPQIEAYAKTLVDAHSTLEMASQRLVDSTRRMKPRDAIVDAVIGLESILLANMVERSELRFRFALHYASLFPKNERKEAFVIARDLYDLRSTIAHGSHLPETLKINGKKVPVGEAVTIARSTLRKTIRHFATDVADPEFMKKDYWLSQALGL